MINYEMPVNIIPENDEERIEKLHRYQIMNTARESDFDAIALLASEIFETDSAFINFIDKDSVFSKANISGFPAHNKDRTHSFCALTILRNDTTVFHDTHQFPEFLNTLYISNNNKIRFYAAAPLKTTDGFLIGTIAVADKMPRLNISERQINVLQSLSKIVMEKLETRLENIETTQAYNEALHRLVHDIKSPVTSISLYAQLLGSKEMTAEKVFGMASKIEKSAGDIATKLNSLFKKP